MITEEGEEEDGKRHSPDHLHQQPGEQYEQYEQKELLLYLYSNISVKWSSTVMFSFLKKQKTEWLHYVCYKWPNVKRVEKLTGHLFYFVILILAQVLLNSKVPSSRAVKLYHTETR